MCIEYYILNYYLSLSRACLRINIAHAFIPLSAYVLIIGSPMIFIRF